jgi:GntR family transcriptional regulator
VGRTLQVDPSDAVPIWKQIEHGVRRLIACGSLPAGASVPSVRDLSRELRVNPATVAKAYQRLCGAGMLVVRRGEGTYVADGPPPMGRAERQKILGDGASRYAIVAMTLGAPLVEAIDEVEAAWKRLTSTSPKGRLR